MLPYRRRRRGVPDDSCRRRGSGFRRRDCPQSPQRHGMYFGHDHINNYIINYDGIHFGYGIKATDRVYADDSMLGGRVIKLANDHSLSYEDIYHTYAEVK